MYDMNTYYLIHGLLKRTYAVTSNPDVLKYKLPKRERGKSATALLNRALKKVNITETTESKLLSDEI